MSLQQLLVWSVARHPDRTLLDQVDGPACVYRSFQPNVRSLAGGLDDVGGGSVALFSPNVPEVVEAGVVGEPDERWSEPVVAYVTVRDDVDEEALDEHSRVGAVLADFKRPREYYFLDEFPKNPPARSIGNDPSRTILVVRTTRLGNRRESSWRIIRIRWYGNP